MHTRPRLVSALGLALGSAACTGLAACSNDAGVTTSGSESAGFSIARAVQELPSTLASDDGVQILVGDLDAATKAAGLERPDVERPATIDAVDDWLLPLTGIGREGDAPVSVFMPITARAENAGRIDEFEEELGWTIVDVSWFVESQLPPNVFTVMGGSFVESDLDGAMGARDGAIWRLGAKDGGFDPTEVSAARPIGESLRLALRGDVLAVGRETPAVEEWLTDQHEPLASDDVQAVAAALDVADVYTALLLTGPAAPGTVYEAIGVGIGFEDGSATATFVYEFADESTAADFVEPLETLLREGSSNATRREWSDMFSVQSITAQGPTLIAQLRLEDLLPRAVMQIVFVRDNLVTLDEAPE